MHELIFIFTKCLKKIYPGHKKNYGKEFNKNLDIESKTVYLEGEIVNHFKAIHNVSKLPLKESYC